MIMMLVPIKFAAVLIVLQTAKFCLLKYLMIKYNWYEWISVDYSMSCDAGDRVLLRDLDSMVRQLLSQERDVDTSRAIRNAVLELDRIQVAMETVRLSTNL